MKSKLAIFIAATALFIGVWFVRPVFAASIVDSRNYVAIIQSVYNNKYAIYATNTNPVNIIDTVYDNHLVVTNSINNVGYIVQDRNTYKYWFDTFSEAYTVATTHDYWSTETTNMNTPLLVTIKGVSNYSGQSDNVFDSLADYEESLQPTWWQKVWDAFNEFATSDAMSAVISGDWLSYLDEVLFGGLWTVKVGEGEDELVEFYTVSATPSPSPSPTPTQIPVSINIDPTTGNVTYNYYIDVSGTPVPTSSPVNPNPPAGSGRGGGNDGLSEPVAIEDYYEPDDSLSLPNLRIFQFKLNLPGTETDIGVDSLDNNFEVMNGYLEDNAEAITTVSSFFQVIPSEWFLLLGAIACFPIIAAMIKSLLGG